MDTKLIEILASGILIIVGTLTGAITQYYLLRKREVERTTIDLRMQHYSALCSEVHGFRDVLDEGCITIKREQRLSSDPPTIYRIKPKKGLQEAEEAFARIEIAAVKATLVASATLANEISCFVEVLDVLIKLMRQANDPMDLQTENDRVNYLWIWGSVLDVTCH
jgi:hypothetical protein